MPFTYRTLMGRTLFTSGVALLFGGLAGLIFVRTVDNVSVVWVLLVVATMVVGAALMIFAGRPETKFVYERFAQWLQSQGFEPDEELSPANRELLARALTDQERALPTAQDVKHVASGRVGRRNVTVAVVQHNFKTNEIDGVQVTEKQEKVSVVYIAWFVELARHVPDLRLASKAPGVTPGAADGEGQPGALITEEPAHQHVVTDAVRASLLSAGEPWTAAVTSGTTVMLHSFGMRIMNVASRGDTGPADAELAKAVALAQAFDAATDSL